MNIRLLIVAFVALLLAGMASAQIVNQGTYSNNCQTTCRATGAHSFTDITIPAGAAGGHAIFNFGYFEVGGTLSSLSLNGQAGTVILAENGDACCYHATLVYFPTPSSGSGLTLSWSNGSDFDDGMQVVGTFYSGGDISSGTTSLIRSSAGESGNDSATTSTLTAQSGDLIAMGYAFETAGTPTFTNGTSVVAVGASPQTGIVEYSPSGNTTMDITATGFFPVIAAAVMKAASSLTLEQEGFRFGVDDANEASHTFEAAQDTNISIADNQSRLLRTLVNASGGDPASAAYTLRYQKNGSGGYVAVPVGSTTASSITNQNVAASADDGQDIGGTNTITGTTIGGSLDATTEWAAMRFTNITIPVGATITSASVGVVPSGTGEDEPLVTVFLEAADSCAAYTTGASNISGRSRGTGVSWSSADLGATGATYHSTPDLTAAVQAVVDRAGWASGNAMCVHIQGGSTATRDLTIEAQDLGPNTNPPRLSVAWTTPNQVYVTTSANITAGGEATTARLTAPSGKTTSDFVTGRRWDDENGTDTIDVTTDDYTEVEWLVFIASSAADSDFFDFRTYAGSSALDTYTLTPRWTIPGGSAAHPFGGKFAGPFRGKF